MNFDEILHELSINALIYYTIIIVYTVIIVKIVNGIINTLLNIFKNKK